MQRFPEFDRTGRPIDPRKLILLTHTSFPYNFSGGGDTQLNSFSRELVSRGVDLEVLSCRSFESVRKDIEPAFHVKCFTVPIPFSLWRYLPARYIPLTLAYIVHLWKKRKETKLIHCFNYRLMSGVVLFLKALFKKPVLVHVIDLGSKYTKVTSQLCTWSPSRRIAILFYYLFDTLDEYMTLRLANVIVCDGLESKNILQHRFGNKVVFIPDIVEPEEKGRNDRELLRQAVGINPNEIAVSYIGRLRDEKGIDLFLKCTDKIHIENVNVKFLVVGEGPFARFIEGFSNVSYLGYRTDVANIYKMSDIVVVPSILEGGIPAVLLEAMSFGKIVVASDITNNRYVIRDGYNGFLFKSGDLGSLTNTLARVIDNLSSSKLQEIQLAAGKTALEFSAPKLVKRLIRVYRSLSEG